MKVLDNNDYIKKTCPYCKSLLGIMCEDIDYIDISGELYAVCAVCGRKVELRYSEISGRWRSIIFADCDW